MWLKKIVRKVIRKLINVSQLTPEEYCENLRNLGIKIGKGTYFFDPVHTIVDTTRPFMLEIGEYVKITGGCIILAHDYSRSVLRKAYGVILGESSKTVIGNNVFLGMGSIILPGTKIGDNVIVGAGSVVSGSIPSNVVIAGNPARKIQNLEDHLSKKEKQNLEKCIAHYMSFYDRYGKRPSIKQMEHYFPIFLNDITKIDENGINLHWNGDDYGEICNSIKNEVNIYSSYEEFIEKENLPD